MSVAPPSVQLEGYQRRGLGVRARIAAVVVSSVILLTAGAGTALIEWETQSWFEGTVERTGAILESEAASVGASLAQADMEGVDAELQELVAIGERLELLRVVVLDHTGRAVAHGRTERHKRREATAKRSGPSSFDYFAERAHDVERGIWWRHRDRFDEPALAVSMPAVAGLRWGTLVATFDMVPFEERLAVMRITVLLAALLLAMVMLFLLVVGLERSVLQPIARLGDAAHALASGDLAARVGSERTDELGELAATFDGMAGALEEHTAHLERKVAKRTEEIEARSAELKEVNERLEEAVQQLALLATTDPLTALLNRRAFVERVGFEAIRAARSGSELSVLMVDADHFKRINDTWGHSTGDEVLRDLAAVIQGALRGTDLVARHGGEEFVCLLLDTPHEAALGVAEKVRASVEGFTFTRTDGRTIPTQTVSVGVAQLRGSAEDVEAMLERADRALYAAKAAGRNRVIPWSEELGEITPLEPPTIQ